MHQYQQNSYESNDDEESESIGYSYKRGSDDESSYDDGEITTIEFTRNVLGLLTI